MDKDITYQVTMSLAKNLFKKGVISPVDYNQFNTKMMEKYKPKYGDLFTRIDLL